jgi:hypothetical protein
MDQLEDGGINPSKKKVQVNEAEKHHAHKVEREAIRV